MRIAVWHNLPSGGAKRALRDHIRGLIDRGHTVESWCPPTADQSYLPLRELVNEHVVPASGLPNGGHRFRLTRGYGDCLDTIKAMDRHCRQCAGEINQSGFDLLLASPCRFLSVPAIARYLRMPAVIYLQEPHRRLYEAAPKLPWVALDRPQGWRQLPGYLKRCGGDLLWVQGLRVQAREELLNARAFISILANSYYSRESILRAYGLDAKVCYLGVDTKLFANQRGAREDLVVGVGMFGSHKKIDFVIRALAHLTPPRPRLVWIGNDADPLYLSGLRRQAASSGVCFEPRVNIQDQELVTILNRARIMAYAPRLEPFGFAALEGNACGLPVVAVAEGGVRETITHGLNGLLVEHDPKSMATAIHHLLDRPEYARQLGENGCTVVSERWTLKDAVERLENRLLEALEKVSTSG
jgi:glycosyltransferase involved in cell wall biosynthesis